jgi:DNA-cytosine methyltransferase
VKIIDLFSGIGGFSLGLESTGGFETIQFVENEPWCQKILAKNFPEVPIAGDIREYEGQRADVVVGGFPCQPFSVAGKRKGTTDDRHLWPEMLRVIKASKPRWVIGENVRNLTSIQDGLVFEQVCTDLESEGFEVQPFIIPASAVNAPHQRYRVWIVAHSNNNGQQGRLFETRNQTITRQRSKIIRRNGANMFGGSSNDGRNQAESTINGPIQRPYHDDETEFTATERLCGVSKDSNEHKNTLRANEHQENHDRTLVQERQQGVQSSEHTRLGDNKTTSKGNKVRPGDDTITRDRVETTTDVANTQCDGLTTTKERGSIEEAVREESQGQNRTLDTQGASNLSETKGNVANSNDTGDRTSEHETQRQGQKIDQRREELTQFESSRLCADVANSNSWLRRGRRAIKPSRENQDRKLYSAQEEQATKYIRSKIIRRSSLRGKTEDVANSESSKSRKQTKWERGKNSQRGSNDSRGFERERPKDVADSKISERDALQTNREHGETTPQEVFRDRSGIQRQTSWWSSEPRVGRVAYGVSDKVDRLKGLGNAIVPQIAYQIGLAILQAEKEK